ncbi:hypothetical protein NLI96_g5191 [Meripilus lineatus]|uniref:Protein kinase domain-containing protein n=1 Tax=Meripilus lineatus TaxID=2056292 RepID=A0AAD5V847_9APHY|nr:hypothetical protein NLI96_g5191 [Physisporinus lineatus]
MVPSKIPGAKKLFYREAVLWYNTNHTHILKFHGVFGQIGDPSGLCMVLQWAENQDLSKYLDILVTQQHLSGQEYISTVNLWLYGIAQGVQCLHGCGIVHGDLRAVNVLIDVTGTVLLADFGLSVIADVGNSFTETHGINALPWTSPELIKSGDDAQGVRPTFESDIYA